MHYVQSEPKEATFEKAGIVGRVFATAELTTKAGFFTVTTQTGHETTIIQHRCDFCYHVLEGTGAFHIGEAEYECTAGDLIVIPEGTPFSYKGTLKMFAISIPPWSEDQEQTL